MSLPALPEQSVRPEQPSCHHAAAGHKEIPCPRAAPPLQGATAGQLSGASAIIYLSSICLLDLPPVYYLLSIYYIHHLSSIYLVIPIIYHLSIISIHLSITYLSIIYLFIYLSSIYYIYHLL